MRCTTLTPSLEAEHERAHGLVNGMADGAPLSQQGNLSAYCARLQDARQGKDESHFEAGASMDETLESFPNGLFNAPRVARARKSMLRLQADLSAMRLNSSRWRWKKYCHASCLERLHVGKPDS